MTLLLSFALALATAQADFSRHVYPLARPIACPPVVLDASDFPEGKAWGEAAKGLVEGWFSTLTTWLATEDFKAPKEIRLVIKKEISAPAYASGGTITINGKWITDHPDDLGMVIHELTHVIQAYPNGKRRPGWLVEGIADYVRWWRYEPELHAGKGRTKPNPEKANYTDSYRTTAMWLAWSSRRYHMGLVPALDRAMRRGDDPLPVFKELTGKEPDELWKEFIAAQS